MSELLIKPLTPTPPVAPGISPGLVWLMALTCGLVVANIYYNQPLLADIGHDFHVTDGQASLIATATQVGYTLGSLLLVPLGDKLERKNFILWLLGSATLCLMGAALAPNYGVLLVVSTLIGICSSVPQLLLPMAAHLAPEADRGRVVGRVMSGLLLGILLSRTVSGFAAAHLGGWRVVFGGGAGLMLALAALLAWQLPRNYPDFRGTYAELMRSLLTLIGELPALRRSSLVGAGIFAGFSVFWTTLVFYLESPVYHYGSDVAGLFGLVGAAGALTALAGRQGGRPPGAALHHHGGGRAGHRGLPGAGRGRRLAHRPDYRHLAARHWRAGGPHRQPNHRLCAAPRGAQSPQHGLHHGLFHGRLHWLGGRRLRLDALRLVGRVRGGRRVRGAGAGGTPVLWAVAICQTGTGRR